MNVDMGVNLHTDVNGQGMRLRGRFIDGPAAAPRRLEPADVGEGEAPGKRKEIRLLKGVAEHEIAPSGI